MLVKMVVHFKLLVAIAIVVTYDVDTVLSVST